MDGTCLKWSKYGTQTYAFAQKQPIHLSKAGEFYFHQMTQVSHAGDSGVVTQAVGEHQDDFVQGYISMVITEWSIFQNQDRFTRAGDLVFIADLGQLEEWIVECIHVEAVAADQHLDADNRTQEGDILDLCSQGHWLSFPAQ